MNPKDIPGRIRRDIRNVPLTYSIIAVLIGMYLIQSSTNGLAHALALTDAVYHGEVWRLLTYGLVHGPIFHVLLNCLALWMFAGPIEYYKLSKSLYIGILASATVLSGVALILVEPTATAVGISGGVSAFLGILVTLRPNVKVLFAGIIPMKFKTGVSLYVAFEATNLTAQILYGAGWLKMLIGVSTGSISHLTGIIYGMLIGALIREQIRQMSRDT